MHAAVVILVGFGHHPVLALVGVGAGVLAVERVLRVSHVAHVAVGLLHVVEHHALGDEPVGALLHVLLHRDAHDVGERLVQCARLALVLQLGRHVGDDVREFVCHHRKLHHGAHGLHSFYAAQAVHHRVGGL